MVTIKKLTPFFYTLPKDPIFFTHVTQNNFLALSPKDPYLGSDLKTPIFFTLIHVSQTPLFPWKTPNCSICHWEIPFCEKNLLPKDPYFSSARALPFTKWYKFPPQCLVKGTGHDFCWSGKTIYHLRKHGNIHIFQNK